MSLLKGANSWLQKILCLFFPAKRGGWGRFDIWKNENDKPVLYLRRFRFVQCKWFGIYLHYIPKPDMDRSLHDHPWDFWAFILNGGYTEDLGILRNQGVVGCQTAQRSRFSFRKVTAASPHKIASVLPNTWTLIFRGKKRRHWGFYSEEGWKHWLEYLRDEGIFEQLEDDYQPQDPDSSLPGEVLG